MILLVSLAVLGLTFLMWIIRDNENDYQSELQKRRGIESDRQDQSRKSTPSNSRLPWSDDFLKSMKLARLESNRFKHDHTGVEHLLAGLVQLEEAPGVAILREAGLNLEMIRTELAPQPGTFLKIGKVPYTPRVKNVMKAAAAHAAANGESQIDTDYILSALLDGQEGPLPPFFLKNNLGREFIQTAILADIEKRQAENSRAGD